MGRHRNTETRDSELSPRRLSLVSGGDLRKKLFAILGRYVSGHGVKLLLAQDLGLIDTMGRRLSLSARTMLVQYRKARTWRYLAMVLGVLLASDPAGTSQRLPVPVYLLGWALGIICYLGGQAALIVSLALLRPRLPRRAIYWPVISALALAPTLLVLERVLGALQGVPDAPVVLDKWLYLLVTLVLFETIYMRFVYTPAPAPEDACAPRAEPEPPEPPESTPLADLPHPEAPAAVPEPRVLLLGTQPVALSELIYLEAKAHHVCAQLSDRTLTLRARLSDVIAQTQDDDGLRTHRSWWVAHHAIQGLEREDGKPVLRLRSGAAVPVARGRLDEVERWCATHLRGNPAA